MIKQLGNTATKSVNQLQQSLNYALPYALSMFQPSPYEMEQASGNIFPPESLIKA